MNNWMPPPRYEKVGDKSLGHDIHANFSTYDLKGCADDKTLKVHGEDVEPVHKRIFNLKMWLGQMFWTKERHHYYCLLYTSPSPRDATLSRMPSSA